MAVEDVQQFIDLLELSPGVTELTVQGANGSKITIKRQVVGQASRPVAQFELLETEKESAEVMPGPITGPPMLSINASLVGLFHVASPPVLPGATVVPGQIVGYVESMRLMNEVVSSVEGTVEIAVALDGQPVEYGQLLFSLAGR